jgi:hypothetical protein
MEAGHPTEPSWRWQPGFAGESAGRRQLEVLQPLQGGKSSWYDFNFDGLTNEDDLNTYIIPNLGQTAGSSNDHHQRKCEETGSEVRQGKPSCELASVTS